MASFYPALSDKSLIAFRMCPSAPVSSLPSRLFPCFWSSEVQPWAEAVAQLQRAWSKRWGQSPVQHKPGMHLSHVTCHGKITALAQEVKAGISVQGHAQLHTLSTPTRATGDLV